MKLLQETYNDKISGVLSCFDRIIFTGTMPQICYAQGMSSYLYFNNIRISDYPKFAEPLKKELRENAEKLASENNISIEFVSKIHIRKKALVRKVLDKRGSQPGLVHIISTMEACGR